MYVCQLSIMWRTTWRVDSTPTLIVIVPWRRHATSYLWNETWSELTLPIFSTQKKNGPWANQSCCSTENLSTELLVSLFSFRYWTGWEPRCSPISVVGLEDWWCSEKQDVLVRRRSLGVCHLLTLYFVSIRLFRRFSGSLIDFHDLVILVLVHSFSIYIFFFNFRVWF